MPRKSSLARRIDTVSFSAFSVLDVLCIDGGNPLSVAGLSEHMGGAAFLSSEEQVTRLLRGLGEQELVEEDGEGVFRPAPDVAFVFDCLYLSDREIVDEAEPRVRLAAFAS